MRLQSHRVETPILWSWRKTLRRGVRSRGHEAGGGSVRDPRLEFGSVKALVVTSVHVVNLLSLQNWRPLNHGLPKDMDDSQCRFFHCQVRLLQCNAQRASAFPLQKGLIYQGLNSIKLANTIWRLVIHESAGLSILAMSHFPCCTHDPDDRIFCYTEAFPSQGISWDTMGEHGTQSVSQSRIILENRQAFDWHSALRSSREREENPPLVFVVVQFEVESVGGRTRSVLISPWYTESDRSSKD